MPALRSDRDAIDEVVDDLLAGRARGDDGRAVDIREYAVPRACADLLTAAAAAAPAGASVEIGLASGLGTLAIARGRLRRGPLPPRSLHAVDPHQAHFARAGLHSVERAGLGASLVFHPHPSHVALPRMLDAGTRLGFAFVDGMHQLDHVLLELFFLDRMLEPGGVIAVHDMWMPGLQHAVSYWTANRAYEPVTVRDATLAPAPVASEHRGCGDPERRPPYFRRHLEPFVDWHTLLLRKTGEDDRAWDLFRPYVD
ncbi:MAG: class I SAM-dependent methyltransferase [Planctomycetota bacterium]|jgi:predicted O-methyltransferase YrrM